MSRHHSIPALSSLVLLTLFCSTLAFSCRSSAPEETGAATTAVLAEPAQIAPGQVRLLATVVRIDPTLDSANPSDPCGRAPCRALIRVDSVLAYGTGFPRPLSAGEEMEAHFAFTLGPTEGVVPGLDRHFPGLPEGSRFRADMRGGPSLGPGQGAGDAFTVFTYTRID